MQKAVMFLYFNSYNYYILELSKLFELDFNYFNSVLCFKLKLEKVLKVFYAKNFRIILEIFE